MISRWRERRLLAGGTLHCGCCSTQPSSAEENFMSASSSDSVVIEIRAAEGGADAKLLVLEQRAIYLRLCTRRSL